MSESPLSLPTLLSERYSLERLLGRGGMASVYLATDLKHGRLVAVKVLDPELAQSVSSERFLQEIRIAAGLAHPHILGLYDSGTDGGVVYCVMPYAAGQTLRERLERERQLPLGEAVRLVCEVADALEYAHRRNILHRDIKPDNILLEDGHAVVADFGVARALDISAAARLTVTGVAVGTPSYMSPEQAVGDGAVDARSDVYALGCVLYELLAGEPPFTGPTARVVIAKRLTGPPPRIRTVRPAVPEAVEQVLLRALDPVPADRFSSALEFRRALENSMLHGPAAPRPTRKRRRLLGGAALVALLAAAGTAWTVRAWLAGSSAVTTVAILPMTNASADPEQAYLADGLTAGVIDDLGHAPGLRVISTASAFHFAMAGMGGATGMPPMGGMAFMDDAAPATAMTGMAAPPGLDEIARRLRADVLLQSSLAHEGDSVRVHATLLRVRGMEPIWAANYTRHVRDVFGLQRELANAVAAAVLPRGPPRKAAVRAYHPDAEVAFAKGRYFQIHWKLPEAVEAFERAVEIDPRHAPAHARLARSWYFLAFFGDEPPGIALGRMRRAATTAFELDSLNAEAHAQLALVKMLQEWDWAGAERHFRQALELSPHEAQIRHDYAHFLLGQGRQRESAEQTRLAVELDPVNPMLISCLGWHSLFDAQYEEAHRHATEANALMPDHWAYVVMGWSLLWQDSTDAALTAFRSAYELRSTSFTLAALGHALAAAGFEEEARATLTRLLERVEDEYVSPYDIATVYAGLGDADNTFRWLRRAADERSAFIVHVGWDARFDRVRRDPRFAELTERELGLPTPRFAALTAAERRGLQDPAERP